MKTMTIEEYHAALLAGARIPIVATREDDGFTSHGEYYPYPKAREKTPTRCALPGCPHETTHNGGYCCADHCREHRQRQRTANAEAHASATKEPIA